MNKQQKPYVLAKAHLQTLKEQEEQLEHKYIIDNNIINDDGKNPSHIWCIDNEEVFEKANAEYCKQNENFLNEIIEAEKILKQAEDDLLKFALDILPSKNSKEKETLEKAVKTNYTTRLKIIDLAFKLDTKH